MSAQRFLLYPSLRALQLQFSWRRRHVLAALLVGAGIVGLSLFYGLYRFFDYVGRAPLLGSFIGPMIGRLLLGKLLEMLYLALLCMLAFSSIIAAFSAFFLDEEIAVLMVSPTSVSRIFWSRFCAMSFESSWMAAIFFLPVFAAFARAFNAAWWVYPIYAVLLLFYLLLPNMFGAILAVLLGVFFPIRQMRKVFQFLSGVVIALLVVFFRYLEPEKLLNPSYFGDVSQYILSLNNPLLSVGPSSWLNSGTRALFAGDLSGAAPFLATFFLILLAGFVLLHLVGKFLYLHAWQASLECVENQVRSLEWVRRAAIFPFRFFAHDFRVIAEKEIAVFLRDPAIFSQVFMMAAIMVVYGFNLSILPLKDLPSLYAGELNDTLVYLNGPFIGFIMAAISMRFVYPSISIEGRAFWAVKCSPIAPRRLIQVKFILYFVPMLCIGVGLCVISNTIFRVSHHLLLWLSLANVLLMSVVITALAVGLGAVYARFDSNNPLKISGSFGGVVFMILCAVYVLNLLILQAYPMFRFYLRRFYPMTSTGSYVLIALSAVLLLFFTFAWVYFPLKKGIETIELFEPE